jgi:transcriptional regulator with XRE-family HTH domain
MAQPQPRRPRLEAFAAYLAATRQHVGITQAELAEQIGCARGMVALWETARAEPPLSRLFPVAAILHVEIADLIEPLRPVAST